MREPTKPPSAPLRGRVVACFGRRSLIEVEDGSTIACVSRGRRTGIACGDRVSVTRTSPGEGVIEDVEPRSCLIYRSDEQREKAIAANITQVVVVLAVAPTPNVDFIDRCLVAAEHAEASTLLVLNKTDLPPGGGEAAHIAASYARLGYRTLPMSTQSPASDLLAALAGHLSVFIGQSGVGKSTLVNRLVPDAGARVGATSATRDAGRHTTTHGQLYRLDEHSAIIDSPGMHAFGLSHVDPSDLASCFIEFRNLLGHCRFSNCRHDGEPGCFLDEAVRTNQIRAERLASYRRILRSLGKRSSGN